MSARLLRGLARKLNRYHSPAPSVKGQKLAQPRVHAEEALDLARAELKWLHEGAREDVKAKRSKVTVSTTSRQLDRGCEERAIARRLVELVRRRVVNHEPVAYILGNQPFGPLDIAIRPPTLIPRPETEEWALRLASVLLDDKNGQPHRSTEEKRPPLRLLDLCSGSGCIGLPLAHLADAARRPLQVTCADVSPQALALIRENMQRNDLDAAHITVAQADLFSMADMQRLVEEQGQPFDVIVCNPPYITAREYEELDESVRSWEDRRALVGDGGSGGGECDASDDGLVFYRRLADLLPILVTRRAVPSPLPLIVVEVGKGQAPAVCDIFERSPLVERCETWRDAWDVQRVVLAYPRKLV